MPSCDASGEKVWQIWELKQQLKNGAFRKKQLKHGAEEFQKQIVASHRTNRDVLGIFLWIIQIPFRNKNCNEKIYC